MKLTAATVHKLTLPASKFKFNRNLQLKNRIALHATEITP